jgi:hypothetical protein
VLAGNVGEFDTETFYGRSNVIAKSPSPVFIGEGLFVFIDNKD